MELSKRQAEIAAFVARGYPNKKIAAELGVSVKTVAEHIREAAERVPGEGWPRFRLTLWFFNLSESDGT